MRVALYTTCWSAVIIGGLGMIFATHINDALVSGIFYIPALFSLVYLATHK